MCVLVVGGGGGGGVVNVCSLYVKLLMCEQSVGYCVYVLLKFRILHLSLPYVASKRSKTLD